jgi:hypothetical protein
MARGKERDPGDHPRAPFDRDVLTIARALIERYGRGARSRALRRVQALQGPSNENARRLWMQVVHAIEAIQAAD